MKLKQPSSVDQSDRKVPFNLRQSGPTPQQMLISTRVRKNPYWHLSVLKMVVQWLNMMH